MKTNIQTKDMKLAEWYHTGSSMHPTLRAGEILDIDPYGGKEVRRGDVIVFNPPDKNKFVIHRVVSVKGGAIRTKGDNNQEIDPWVLSPEHIVGKVTYGRSGRRRKRIAVGLEGRVHASGVSFLHKGVLSLKALFRPFYHRLAAEGTIRRLFPLESRLRVIAVKRDGGTEQMLLLGRRVIGRRMPHDSQWQIRHPFRLFVDDHALSGKRPVHGSLPENRMQ